MSLGAGTTASSTSGHEALVEESVETPPGAPEIWANYYWAIITHLKGILKVFNRTLR